MNSWKLMTASKTQMAVKQKKRALGSRLLSGCAAVPAWRHSASSISSASASACSWGVCVYIVRRKDCLRKWNLWIQWYLVRKRGRFAYYEFEVTCSKSVKCECVRHVEDIQSIGCQSWQYPSGSEEQGRHKVIKCSGWLSFISQSVVLYCIAFTYDYVILFPSRTLLKEQIISN